jgi:hypothetical protein
VNKELQTTTHEPETTNRRCEQMKALAVVLMGIASVIASLATLISVLHH